MISKVRSSALIGLDSELIEVECDAGFGQALFIIVGLPDTSVQESRERIRAAFRNSNIPFPRGRVTVNLAPADIKKEGPSYDVPIALSIVLSHEEFCATIAPNMREILEKSIFLGELGLDGGVRPVRGVLSSVWSARQRGIQNVFVPQGNVAEAMLVRDINVYGVSLFSDLVRHMQDGNTLSLSIEGGNRVIVDPIYPFDMAHIHGQSHAKRALEIAAAGGHNILLVGSPGAGKTLLARVMPSILPPMTEEEMFEVTRLYSVAGLVTPEMPLVCNRPFRSPHHSSSVPAMVGGGSCPRPGEISLAHRGVLFMDEFPEFPHSVLESLRQPLEDGVVTVSRASGSVTYPARCILLAAQNPCPCGYYGDKKVQCTCAAGVISKYQKKISGPLLDRIDLFVSVPRVEVNEFSQNINTENSAVIRARVCKARELQSDRLRDFGCVCNAEMSSRMIEETIQISAEVRRLLEKAVLDFNLSARSYYRVIKLARTIADLQSEEVLSISHVAQALQYRPSSSSEY